MNVTYWAMTIFVYIIISILGLGIIVAIVWRLASHRHALPCPAWLRWFIELDNPFTKTNRAAFIVDHMYLEPGMAVLDAGCGPGRLTIPVARRVGDRGNVVAMDIQDGMLSRVKTKVEASNLTNVTFMHVGLGDSKLENERFDRALLVTVLGEIPDRKKALKEIFDALKPGGILTVTEVVFDPHYQRRSAVSRLATEVGFHEKDFFGNRLAFILNLEKCNKE